MATCPSGHESASDDFCDVCGIRIAADGSLAVSEAASPVAEEPPAEPCPRCGTERAGQFCEGCGYKFADAATSVSAPSPLAPSAPDPAAWTAVVAADRDYYDQMRSVSDSDSDAAEISFPPYCPERRFRLSGAEIRIGRRSESRGIDPEIDLTGPPTDPGVSRLHAVLLAGPDGAWSVLDPGSVNGTLVNGSEIPRDKTVPLTDGDRIHLGAWTRITISRG